MLPPGRSHPPSERSAVDRVAVASDVSPLSQSGLDDPAPPIFPSRAQRLAIHAASRVTSCSAPVEPVNTNGVLGIQADALLPGTGPGGSIEAVLQKRIEQIAKGYSPAEDAKGPDCFLKNAAGRYLYHAKLARTKGGDLAALQRARAAYVTAASLLLATIDRIDFLTAAEARKEDNHNNEF